MGRRINELVDRQIVTNGWVGILTSGWVGRLTSAWVVGRQIDERVGRHAKGEGGWMPGWVRG